jgi:hypothetical protein
MLRLTVAFATADHAAAGLAFIDRAHLEVRQAAPSRGGVGGECVQVELEVRADDAMRLETLLRGVHAFVVAEPVRAADPEFVTAGRPA